MQNSLSLLALAFPAMLIAQNHPDSGNAFDQVLERLKSLEQQGARLEQQNTKLQQQNAELRVEIDQMRTELTSRLAPPAAADTASLPDRVAVVENRVAEQSQTKVEAAHRLPVSLTGMVLFNAFANTGSSPPATSTLLTGPDADGATVGQSLLGLRFDGPPLPGGGRVTGFLDMDFLGAAGSGSYGYNLRLRRAIVDFDWADRSLIVGEDKPLISQRQPDSLAEVAYPPLADSGNPWYWQPQVRYEERFHLGAHSGVKAEAALIETNEDAQYTPGPNYYSVDPVRPGFEARVDFWHSADDTTRYEFAPGLHVSTSHINGYSVPSQFETVDWLIQPVRWLQFSGLVFGGQNMANLGGFSEGFTFSGYGVPRAVRGLGGWAQVAFPITSRLTLNTFGGMQAPETAGLPEYAVSHESAFAANLIFRMRSNVLLGLEALQQRTGIVEQKHTVQNHYDVSIGYLF